MTWTSCVTAPWRRYSAASAPRPAWVVPAVVTWGNVRQLDAVARRFLGALAAGTPLLPGAEVLAFIDMDSMQKRVYGHRKGRHGFGHTKIQGKSLLVRGLNALAAVISTPLAASVIAATRLRGGTANSARRVAGRRSHHHSPPGWMQRPAGVPDRLGLLLRRASCRPPAAAARAFSVTVPVDRKICAAIASISEDAWTPITYPRAVWDRTGPADL